MKHFTYPAAAAVLALLIGAPANAQTREEALAQFEERFAAADTNKDGKLTKQEAKDGKMDRLARFFGRVDSDGDGFVTKAQLRARIDKNFE